MFDVKANAEYENLTQATLVVLGASCKDVLVPLDGDFQMR